MSLDAFTCIPFVSQGRDYSGCDCWGLVWLWYRDVLGVDLTSYAETPAGRVRDIAKLIEQYKTEWVSVVSPAPNDVVLMRAITGHASRLVAHVGVAMPGNRVMHIEEHDGFRLERLDAPHIAPRVMEYRRHHLAA